MRDLWARVGITLHLTDDEAQKLLVDYEDDMKSRKNIIKNVFADGRFELDGETYVPYGSIEDYNRQYGTDLPEEDYDLYD